MAKRTKYEVHNIDGHTAKFSNLWHALVFAINVSQRLPGRFIEVRAPDGLVGQYQDGRPTDEFRQHHVAGMFR